MPALDGQTVPHRPLRNLSRLVADSHAVLRRARPASAARWLSRLVTRLPQVLRSRSLVAADSAWRSGGAQFRTPGGRYVTLPGEHTAGAREIYCRNVYLRGGLRIPAGGWVVDLGANAGLFTLLAAVDGARVVAVDAQQGFSPETARLLSRNRVDPARVQFVTGMAASGAPGVALVGFLTDDARWRTASHAGTARPPQVSVPQLLTRYDIDRIGLLKVDIEGSEFSLFHPDGPTGWLDRVDQIAMEVHPTYGDVGSLIELLAGHGFAVKVTDDDGRPAATSAASYLYAWRPTGR